MQHFGNPAPIPAARSSWAASNEGRQSATQAGLAQSDSKVLVKVINAELDDLIHSLGPRVVAYATRCTKAGLPRVKLYEIAKECLPLKINRVVETPKRTHTPRRHLSAEPFDTYESPSSVWRSLARPTYEFV